MWKLFTLRYSPPQSRGDLNIQIGQGVHFHFFLNHMLLHLNHSIKNEKRQNKGWTKWLLIPQQQNPVNTLPCVSKIIVVQVNIKDFHSIFSLLPKAKAFLSWRNSSPQTVRLHLGSWTGIIKPGWIKASAGRVTSFCRRAFLSPFSDHSLPMLVYTGKRWERRPRLGRRMDEISLVVEAVTG